LHSAVTISAVAIAREPPIPLPRAICHGHLTTGIPRSVVAPASPCGRQLPAAAPPRCSSTAPTCELRLVTMISAFELSGASCDVAEAVNGCPPWWPAERARGSG
jgi:hypothetical protein